MITVQQLPIFLVGLDGTITEWQLGVAFSPNRLPSIPGTLVPVTLKLKNTFPQLDHRPRQHSRTAELAD